MGKTMKSRRWNYWVEKVLPSGTWTSSRQRRHVMMRYSLLIAALLILPFNAFAGPKEDAQAAFDKFLTNITAADIDGVVGLFWPDALFWGTTMRNLATTPEAIREYFKPGLATRKPNELKATLAGPTSVLVLSDFVVLISGMGQIEREVDGKPVVGEPLRVSVAVTKRGDRWAMSQLHNSPRPKPQ
jgi:ketosteroid isomerase-like protein